MIDNYAVKLFSDVNNCGIFPIFIEENLSLTVGKVDEENFWFVDIDPKEVPNLIKIECINRNQVINNDEKFVFSLHRAANKIALNNRRTLGNKLNESFSIEFDDLLNGVIVYNKKLIHSFSENNVWECCLFYKELEPNLIRLFTGPKVLEDGFAYNQYAYIEV